MDSTVGRRRLRTLGAVLGDVAADPAERVEEMHSGIAGRVFAAVGAGGIPVQAVHDTVAATVYSAVRGGLRTAGRLGGLVAAATPLAERPGLAGPQASLVEGAV